MDKNKNVNITKEEKAIYYLKSLPINCQEQVCWMMKGIAVVNNNKNSIKNILNLKKENDKN